MKKIILLSLALGVLFAVSGCKSQPVQTVNSQYLPATVSQKQRTADNVRAAIIKGAAERGWIISDIKPGVLRGVLDIRAKHHVEVDIPYTAESYSIVYVTSTGMNAEDGTIHRQYNKWVTNLDLSIKKFLSTE